MVNFLGLSWGKRKQQKMTLTAPAAPPQVTPYNGHIPPMSGSDVTRGMALKYLWATLQVLHREGIPLANPVNGEPARGARFFEIPINLDTQQISAAAMRKVLSLSTLQAVQVSARVDGVMARQDKDRIIFQYQLDEGFWQQYTRADLPAPEGIGLGAGRKLVKFTLEGQTLVAGMTRSGKSVTVESIIFAIMQAYKPSQVRLAIVDTHHTLGIRKKDLNAYVVGEFTNAEHLWCPLAYNDKDAELTINGVYAEWLRRKGRNIQDAYALVLVIDELLDEAVLGAQASGGKYVYQDRLIKISQLAAFGAKYNIFVVLGAQDPKISNTSDALMRNLGIRYIGHVFDDQVSRNLTGIPHAGAHLLTFRGDFLKISPDTTAAASSTNFNIKSRFQVAEPTKQDFDRLVRNPIADPRPVDPVILAEGSESTIEQPAINEALDLEPVLVFKGSNREIVVDAYTLALYFYYKSFSISQAEATFGIKRRTHEKHIRYAADVIEEVNRLKEGFEPRSPYYQRLREERVRKTYQ